jgi:hypothetical protein
MQLIVNREGHMAAISYHTEPPKSDAPSHVTVGASYWSYNYGNLNSQLVAVVFLYAFGVATILHDWRQFFAWLRIPAEHRPKGGLQLDYYNMCMYLIKLPSILLPLALETLRSHLALPTWIFAITVRGCLMGYLSIPRPR